MTYLPALPVAGEPLSESTYYIAARAPRARPRRILKSDDTFAVLDNHGDIGVSAGDPDGVFSRDTRFLSFLEITINGQQPLLLGSHVRDDNTLLRIDLTNPDIFSGPDLVLAKDTIHIVRTVFVWKDCLYSRIAIENFSHEAVDLAIGLRFANDFADIFEARGMQRAKRGRQQGRVLNTHEVALTYLGLDDITRHTHLNFEPWPSRLTSSDALYEVRIAPDERRAVFLTVGCDRETGAEQRGFLRSLLDAGRMRRRARRNAPAIETSSDVIDEILGRSMSDLRMLTTHTADGVYPYAGIPWYSTTFGRDGIITALQMLWIMPDLAKGVLTRLAACQATQEDPRNDAEPGKIVHEMRGGEMANLREVPFARYYGSVDATPLFLVLAAQYYQRTGDLETVRGIWPNILLALAWIREHSSEDPQGFLRHSRNPTDGLANQGWKDSYDSIFHADGHLAEGAIALAEVQAYVFAAKRAIAPLAAALGHPDDAERLKQEAEALARRFDAAFWCDDLGTYAIALDGEGAPCRVQTSNAGHALFGGIAPASRAEPIAAGLLSPKFFSGWGVRTVATGESRYNPMSYHNGSIWPHDNSLIALGLARYGRKAEAARLADAIFQAASYMDLRRLPELYCGFKRESGQGPTLYPVACAPQAWASGTPFALLQACLGIEVDPAVRRIRLVEPVLPAAINRVTLRDFAVDGARVSFSVMRHGDATALEILDNAGDVEIAICPRVRGV